MIKLKPISLSFAHLRSIKLNRILNRLSKLSAGITLLFCGVCIGAIALDFAVYILINYGAPISKLYLFGLFVFLVATLGFLCYHLPSNEADLKIDSNQQTLNNFFQE